MLGQVLRGWASHHTLPAALQANQIETAQMRNLDLKRGRIAAATCLSSRRHRSGGLGCFADLICSRLDAITPDLIDTLGIKIKLQFPANAPNAVANTSP